MSERYTPWCLNDKAGAPWGIKDTHTGINVLGDFLAVKTGAVMTGTKAGAEALIASGRKWEFSQQAKKLVRVSPA